MRNLKVSLRLPRNKSERAFIFEALEMKLKILRRGWPDYFCVTPEGKLMLVEVKKDKITPLKKEQLFVMSELSRLGILCYKWDPEAGLKKIRFNSKLGLKLKVVERKRRFRN